MCFSPGINIPICPSPPGITAVYPVGQGEREKAENMDFFYSLLQQPQVRVPWGQCVPRMKELFLFE